MKLLEYSDGEILTEGMADSLILNELKIRKDLSHSSEIDVLEGLESEDEINEGVDIITELIRDYRQSHMELKSKLGNEYEAPVSKL